MRRYAPLLAHTLRRAPRKRSSFPTPASLVIINTLKGIPPVRRRLRVLPYAKLYNGILCQLAC